MSNSFFSPLIFVFIGSPWVAIPTVVAQSNQTQGTSLAVPEPPKEGVSESQTMVNWGGYVEAYASYNFNRPADRLTRYRGFDNRANIFSLSNASIDVDWRHRSVNGRLALQFGHTPDDYYQLAPSSNAAPGTAKNNTDFWRYLQEAYVGWGPAWAPKLQLEAGLFLSPVGPESIRVKDNWNWSRSNLFYALPYYHLGVRGIYRVDTHTQASLWVTNGWNSVLNPVGYLSAAIVLRQAWDRLLSWQLLYWLGVERTKDAPEGRPLRNMLDMFAEWSATNWCTFMAHGNTGFENGHLGVSLWAAAALYARFQIKPWLHVTTRVDSFFENRPNYLGLYASRMFFPTSRVTGMTLTLDFRPEKYLSLRLEGRHDDASTPIYVSHDARIDANGFASPNIRGQTTLTLGAVAWF